MYKFLLLSLLFAGNTQTEHIISEPITSEINTEEDVFSDEEIFESNEIQRGITAWLGLPEKQLTPENLVLNSIYRIVNTIQTQYVTEFIFRSKYNCRDAQATLVITLTLLATNLCIKYNSPLYGEAHSKISFTRIIQDLLISNTAQQLLINLCDKIGFLKKEDGIKVHHFFVLWLCFKQLHQRVDIIKKITDENFTIESRMIPEEFQGKEYFVLNSPINNLSQSIYLISYMLNSIGFKNEQIPLIYKKINDFINSEVSYQILANTITEIPTTIPWTKRLFILKSDAEKHLSSEDYETLKDLVQSDYQYAMEKIVHFSKGRDLLISQAKKNDCLPYIS